MEFLEEVEFILQGVAGPAAGSVEFGDDLAARVEPHIVDAVDVAVQRAAEIRATSAQGVFHGIDDGIGGQVGEVGDRSFLGFGHGGDLSGVIGLWRVRD